MFRFFRPRHQVSVLGNLAITMIPHEDFTGNYWSHMIEYMLNRGFYCQNYVSEIASKSVIMLFKLVK